MKNCKISLKILITKESLKVWMNLQNELKLRAGIHMLQAFKSQNYVNICK